MHTPAAAAARAAPPVRQRERRRQILQYSRSTASATASAHVDDRELDGGQGIHAPAAASIRAGMADRDHVLQRGDRLVE
jgi:hypothetical protein